MPSRKRTEAELSEDETGTEENMESEQAGGKAKQTVKRSKSKTPVKTATKKTVGSKTKKTKTSTTNATKGKAAAKGKKVTKKKDKSSRFFKLIDIKTGKSYGRYTGDTPKQAASKGFTKMVHKLKVVGKTPPKKTTIYLRESTRGSLKKYYGYEASRLKLDEPQVLTITGDDGVEKDITYNFRNKIKKVSVPEQIGGVVLKKAGTKKPAGKKSSKAKTPEKKTSTKKAATKKAPAKKAASKITKKASPKATSNK